MPRCDHCDGQMKREHPWDKHYTCQQCGGRRQIGAKKGKRSY
jgi:primosomal protein N'